VLERKYAGPLKWFVFPVFDIIMAAIGLRAMFVGIPSIEALYPAVIAEAIYMAWFVLGVVCFVGAAFPRLWPFEIVGKIALLSMLCLYLIAMRASPSTVDGAKDAVSLLLLAAILIPCLRLWILGIEERARRAA
jgi:O-antigen ligase